LSYLAGVLVISALLAQHAFPAEPEGDANPQAVEIERIVSEINQKRGYDALKRFREMDQAAREAAIPHLISTLESSLYPYWGTQASYLSQALAAAGEAAVAPLCQALNSETEKVRIQAAIGLRDLNAAARPAIPRLLGMLSDDTRSCRTIAVAALARIAPGDPALLDPMIDALAIPNAQYTAADALAEIGKPAVPALIDCLEASPKRRYGAILALKQMRADAAPAVPALINIVAADGENRNMGGYGAAKALGAIGAAAAVPLAEVLQMPDAARLRRAGEGPWEEIAAYGRYECVRAAFEALGPRGAGAMRLLTDLLRTGDAAQRVAALHCLGHIGLPAGEAVAEVRQCLRHESADVRCAACTILERLGPGAGVALPEVRLLVDDHSEDVRAAAIKALDALEPDAGKVVPSVVRALDDPSMMVQNAAAAVAADLGPMARPAEPGLLRMLGDFRVQNTGGLIFYESPALLALEKIDMSPAAAAGVVRLSILNEWYLHEKLRDNILQMIDERAADAAPLLIETMKSDDVELSTWACSLLARMGKHGSAAVDFIMSSFTRNKRRSWDIWMGMQGNGPCLDPATFAEMSDAILLQAGAEAVAALAKVYRTSDDERVRNRAFFVLMQMRCQEVVPVLAEAMAEKHEGEPPYWVLGTAIWRAEAAAEALGEIGPQAKAAVPALRQAAARVDTLKRADRYKYKSPAGGRNVDYYGVAVEAHLALFRITGELQPQMAFLAKHGEAQKLKEFGKPAVPFLIELFENGDDRTRHCARVMLADLGADAKAALPAMIEDARASGHCGSLAYLAGALGKEGRQAIPVISDCLKADPPGTYALDAIGVLGGIGKPLIPDLLKLYSDLPDEDSRTRTLKALAGLGADLTPLAEQHVPRLIAQLAEADAASSRHPMRYDHNWSVGDQLRVFGPLAAPATDQLIGIVENGNCWYSDEAIRILGAIGPAAERAIPALHAQTARYDRGKAAAEALRAIRGETQPD